MSTLVSANTEVLTTDACWRLLDDSAVGRLAVVRGGEPDIFPVNYVVDHGGILFRTAAGPKLAAARDRVVAFEADGYTAQDSSAWSVVVQGGGSSGRGGRRGCRPAVRSTRSMAVRGQAVAPPDRPDVGDRAAHPRRGRRPTAHLTGRVAS
jgi:Pyridoxamine 5'-phosphate oxidase